MGKRLQGVVFGLIVGVIVAGGAAYAAFVVPNVDPQPTDRYYGCFSSVGKLKASTVQVNNAGRRSVLRPPMSSDRGMRARRPRRCNVGRPGACYRPIPGRRCSGYRRGIYIRPCAYGGLQKADGRTQGDQLGSKPSLRNDCDCDDNVGAWGRGYPDGSSQQFNPTNPDVLLNGINYLGGSGLADSVAAYSSIEVNNSGPSNLTIGHVRVYCLPY